jgi:Tfp pilus assembly protein PilV
VGLVCKWFRRVDNAESGIGLIEVLIAMLLISTTSVLAVTTMTGAFRDNDIGSQRLQASELLATVLRTDGCGAVTTVAEAGTTFHVTVTPGTCAAGTSDTGTVTWTTSGKSNQMSITSVSPPSSGGASAYAVTT